MMVTVAKSLDVPIKLVFPRPAPADSPSKQPSLAMLGLGDVVLPGIMIGLALRFDLFLFYLRKQRRIETDSQNGAPIIQKPKYFSLAGRWSDHFWTHSLFGRPLYYTSNDSKPEPPFTFPKTYFKASIVGYVIGMLTTLGVMHVWGHAQPALLYLVPGVLISLWGTALVRGELSLMWEFSEAVEEDEEDGEKSKNDGEKSADGSNTGPERSSFFSLSDKKSQDREARMRKAVSKHITVDDSEDGDDAQENINSKKNRVKEAAGHKSKREVFSFSIEAPWNLKEPRSIRRGASDPDLGSEEDISPIEKGKPDWAPSEVEQRAEEPAGKRVRLR